MSAVEKRKKTRKECKPVYMSNASSSLLTLAYKAASAEASPQMHGKCEKLEKL